MKSSCSERRARRRARHPGNPRMTVRTFTRPGRGRPRWRGGDAGARMALPMTVVVPEPERRFDPQEPADVLIAHLDASRDGLSAREAQRRLEQFGPNVISRREGAAHCGSSPRSSRTHSPSCSGRRGCCRR